MHKEVLNKIKEAYGLELHKEYYVEHLGKIHKGVINEFIITNNTCIVSFDPDEERHDYISINANNVGKTIEECAEKVKQYLIKHYEA